jgi:hypothetical protein
MTATMISEIDYSSLSPADRAAVFDDKKLMRLFRAVRYNTRMVALSTSWPVNKLTGQRRIPKRYRKGV